MMEYKLYPNLSSAPPEVLGPRSAKNPQVAYHVSVIQAKMQGLKNKERMFKQKYEKYTKTLNRLTWLNACSSGISSVATFTTFRTTDLHSLKFGENYSSIAGKTRCFKLKRKHNKSHFQDDTGLE